MGRYVLCRVNELTGFVLSFAPSSLRTNMYPKLKKINRREVAKPRDSKLIQTEKKTPSFTDELYLFRGLQERQQPAEI